MTTCKSIERRTYISTNIQIYKPTNIQIYKPTNIQIHKYTNDITITICDTNNFQYDEDQGDSKAEKRRVRKEQVGHKGRCSQATTLQTRHRCVEGDPPLPEKHRVTNPQVAVPTTRSRSCLELGQDEEPPLSVGGGARPAGGCRSLPDEYVHRGKPHRNPRQEGDNPAT